MGEGQTYRRKKGKHIGLPVRHFNGSWVSFLFICFPCNFDGILSGIKHVSNQYSLRYFLVNYFVITYDQIPVSFINFFKI
jgi:hypothetical protein